MEITTFGLLLNKSKNFLYKCCFVILMITFISGCIRKNELFSGEYCLINKDETRIAEILELKRDYSFIFSGLRNKDSYKLTWVVTGTWYIANDTLYLDGEKDYSDSTSYKINLDYLGRFTDSIKYLDQAITLFREYPVMIQENRLVINREEKEYLYEKGNCDQINTLPNKNN